MSIGLKGNEVRVEAHDDAWVARFEAEKKALEEILKPLAARIRIEHVGSTSVKDLSAKPIIDVAVGLPQRELVGRALELLLKADRLYLKWGNQPGMLLMAYGDPREVFYHLVVRNSAAWDRLISIRNQLRRFPKIAKEYEALKKRLAEAHPDSRLAYAAGKKAFLTSLLSRGLEDVGRARMVQRRWQAESRLEADLADHYGFHLSLGGRTGVDPDIQESLLSMDRFPA